MLIVNVLGAFSDYYVHEWTSYREQNKRARSVRVNFGACELCGKGKVMRRVGISGI